MIKENIARRTRPGEVSPDVERIVELYDDYCKLETQLNQKRHERNTNAASLKKKKGCSGDSPGSLLVIELGRQLKSEIEAMDQRMRDILEKLREDSAHLPNETHPATPSGENPLVIYQQDFGRNHPSSTSPSNTPIPDPTRDHIALGERFDLFDFSSAATVTGAKFCYLRNEAALFELALINWAMQKLVRRGFTPILTPDLAHQSMVESCGFQPRGSNSQIYSVGIGQGSGCRQTDLCLIGTSEITLAGLHADQVLTETQLPLKQVGFSHCFRAEAGSLGSAARGLYRLHQFSKVEMFAVTTPEESDKMHLEMLEVEQELLRELELPYRVLEMPTLELGAPAFRKFDIEVWMPSRGDWGEVTSTSNCTDYQARRLGIRYRPEASDLPIHSTSPSPSSSSSQQPPVKLQFAHTVNGTAIAVPRIILSILENHYDPVRDVIVVPPTLRPYLGGLETISPRKKKT
jgi:seryl-tRNA synthetase